MPYRLALFPYGDGANYVCSKRSGPTHMSRPTAFAITDCPLYRAEQLAR